MSAVEAYRTYRETQVQTASRADLITMLYNGAIRFTNSAAEALERGDFAEVGRCAGKTQDILGELSNSLDFSAGEIANNLAQLYDYMSWRLLRSQLEKNARGFREVAELLTGLRDAWVEAMSGLKRREGKGTVFSA